MSDNKDIAILKERMNALEKTLKEHEARFDKIVDFLEMRLVVTDTQYKSSSEADSLDVRMNKLLKHATFILQESEKKPKFKFINGEMIEVKNDEIQEK